MQIVLNGQMRTIEPPCSVEELLRLLKPEGGACAVEVNRELVPRVEHRRQLLSEGDRVEVVTLVGGG
jgi:sulfur carrier protein